MMGDVSHQKRALRAELRERRRNMTSSERSAATDRISKNLIDLVRKLNARSVSAYLPATDEPDIRPFLAWAEEQNLRVLMPVSRDDGLLDWVIAGGLETTGIHGMPQAVGVLLGPIAINDVDLIIAPAASIDRSGARLGWGRGYYDRMLGSTEKCPPVYAVIFDGELSDMLPTELHDRRVDGVVMPSGIVPL
jgi:5-formyltetrahydrofolate cyclo-ligase